MRFLIIRATGSGDVYTRAVECTTVNALLCALGWGTVGGEQDASSDAVKEWAAEARPADIYYVQGRAIVAAPDECFSWANVECPFCKFHGEGAVAYGKPAVSANKKDVELRAECPRCHKRWADVFMLANRCELPSIAKPKKTKKK